MIIAASSQNTWLSLESLTALIAAENGLAAFGFVGGGVRLTVMVGVVP
jgi:hypothetical protein